MNEQTNPVHILLAEDDQIDAKAFFRAMEKLRIQNPVVLAKDGLEAWDMLKGQNGHQPLPRPHLLVLDVNMPRLSGLELVDRIRADEDLRDTIIFMLTTSNDEADKMAAFDLNVAGYMLKSDVGNSFIRAVQLVDNYWRVVEFPPNRRARELDDRRHYVRHPSARGVL